MKFAYNEWGNTASWNYTGPNMGRWVANFSPYVIENGGNAGVTFEDGTQHPFTDGMSTNGSDMQYNGATKIALLKSGIQYNFSSASQVTKGDANGNYITYVKDGAGKTTQIVDTLGRSVNIYYENPSDVTLPSRITVLNHTGLPAQILTYTFEYEFRNVDPSVYGYTPAGVVAGNYPFLTRINLPDGKFWAFTYYHGVSASTLLLASVTYPMGGTTTYNYTGSNAQLDAKCKQKVMNANNGQGNVTTSYQHSHCYPANQPPDNCSGDPQAIHSVNIIDPDSATTNVIFNSDGKESSRTGSGKSEYTTWTGSHVQIKQVIVDGYETRTDYQYDVSNGNLLQEEVKPGSGMGTDLNFRGRRTVRTWQSFGNNVYRVQTENVYDLNNALATSLVSQTQYGYDEYVTYPMTDRGPGVAGHLDSYNTGYTTRGNVTTVSRWLASESRWIATHSFYDTLGNVVKTRDAKNYDTVINYGSTNAFAYPTQVINPKGHTTNTVYKFYTGQVESVTNANNFTTTTTYDSLNRVTRIDFPDTSYVRATYDLTINNFSTTIYKSITASQEAASTTYLDGVGREKQKRKSDPAGDIYVDTVYEVCDCNGKVSKVSNPYRLGEIVYWTQTKFDALGRPMKIIPPDGTETQNFTSYTYGPMKTAVTDPAGKARRYHYDVLGRIWKVVPSDTRPDPFSGTLSHESAIFASMHQHFFTSPAMPVGAGDALYAYIYLDPKNMPSEVMLQWNDGAGWEHRAYWGADNIAWGVNGTNSRRYMGALPASGQ
ncbi:MAG TPA: hypothetical protein VGK99_23465 [Acidobacteriota bacterium]|jgi:YD repeat-containing protein